MVKRTTQFKKGRIVFVQGRWKGRVLGETAADKLRVKVLEGLPAYDPYNGIYTYDKSFIKLERKYNANGRRSV